MGKSKLQRIAFLSFFLYISINLSNSNAVVDTFVPFDQAHECFTQQNEPTCSFSISNKAAFDLKTECVSTNGSIPVIRVQGEFDKLKIKCSASYPIDFLYYGIQPTEAMLIDWWKEITPHADLSLQNYTVEVTVYSVQALFDFYNNPANSYYENPKEGLPLKTVHDYSRSGNFSFTGIFNKTIGTSFFLYLEDKARPSFLRNNHTQKIKVIDTKMVIPCIPSHRNVQVDLQMSHPVLPNWDPIVGYSIDMPSEPEGNYSCTLKVDEDHFDEIAFQYKNDMSHDKDIFFGLEDFNTVNSDFIDIGCETVADPYVKQLYPYCKTRDPNVPVDVDKLKMITVPIHNYGYMRLVQQFALPKFVNRSYTAKIVDGVDGHWNSLVRTIRAPNGNFLRTGTIYCTTGYAERIIDFGSPIRGNAIPFNFGLDWATFDRRNPDISTHFGLEVHNHTGAFYTDTEIKFECRVNHPVLVKPVVWYSEWENGSIIQEMIDYNIDEDKSFHSVKILKNLRKIYCVASYWYSDFWRNISKVIDPQEATKPVISSTESNLNFPLGSETSNIRCDAKGTPDPEVYFERHGKRVTEGVLSTPGRVLVFFPTFNASYTGYYTCVAKNVYETRKQFHIGLEEDDNGVNIVLVIVIPLIVFVLTALAAYIYIKFFRPEKTGLTKQEIEDFMKGLQTKGNISAAEGNDYAHEFAAMCPYSKEYEIIPERFRIDEAKVLGSGAFGLVLEGSVDRYPVAVKTVQRNADKQYIKALLSELKIMIYLGHHDHLVPVIGAYTKDLHKGHVYVFVKYLSNGNLQSYLRNNKSFFDVKDSSYINTQTGELHNTNMFGMSDLMRWSQQIASGMQYLGSKKVIHGDLAARNILLDELKNVKITDFGLSRQLYDYNDYIKKHQEPLPWRWMALESLKYLSFSKHSDVWAYGVAIWEIFSLGEVPYPGYSWNLSFVEELELGLRMGKPKYGSPQLFSIMSSCWHQDPLQRPSFEAIISMLEQCEVPLPVAQEDVEQSIDAVDTLA